MSADLHINKKSGLSVLGRIFHVFLRCNRSNKFQLRPLHSTLESDPIVAKNLKPFVSSMFQKVEKCQNLADQRQWENLAQFCHQIKGGFGSFGFPELHSLAGEIECFSHQLLKANSGLTSNPEFSDDLSAADTINHITSKIKELAILAKRTQLVNLKESET